MCSSARDERRFGKFPVGRAVVVPSVAQQRYRARQWQQPDVKCFGVVGWVAGRCGARKPQTGAFSCSSSSFSAVKLGSASIASDPVANA